MARESFGRFLTSSQLTNSEGDGEREGVLFARGEGTVGVGGCFQTITSSSSARGNESFESCANSTADMSNENTASSTGGVNWRKGSNSVTITYNEELIIMILELVTNLGSLWGEWRRSQ